MESKTEQTILWPWINGKPHIDMGRKTEDLLSPWDGTLVTKVAMADETTIDAAIASAREALLRIEM